MEQMAKGRGRVKFIICNITFLCKLIIFNLTLELANIKMFNLQRKLTHFSRLPVPSPYKRWSKCSVEKVEKKVYAAFFGNLGGRKVY